MATIESYVTPQRLYRYRSLENFNREIGAIEEGYLYCLAYEDLNDPMEGLFSSSLMLRKRGNYRAIRDAIIDSISLFVIARLTMLSMKSCAYVRLNCFSAASIPTGLS